MRRAVPRLLAGLLALGLPAPAAAHDGPPFPIVVDAPMGADLVSVWTDPDIGGGTVFVVIDGPGRNGVRPPDAVHVAVQPVSGRLAEVVQPAEAQPVRRGARFYAEVPLDRGEWWAVRVTVDGPDGRGEVTAEVEATPDGSIGPIGLVVYAIPFMLVAALWIRVTLVRRPGHG
jgi:hypothetical protein